MPELRPERADIQFENFRLDLRAGELFKAGERVPLQEQPMKVLALLLETPGEVVTRDELRRRLWPDDTFVDFDHGLNKAINKLRDALDDSAQHPRFVETLPRRGYRFVAAVAEPDAPRPVEQRPPKPKHAVIVLAAIVALAVVLWRSVPRRGDEMAPRGERAMLAVLPFESLSADGDQDYFSDGLTEEMISQLASLNPERLGVIARTSSMHYKNTRKRLDDIASELGVGYVLEGTVRRAGDRLRISAQLIQTSDQTHLWTESYDRRLEDVFAIQKDVAERIARSLTLELLPRTPYRAPTSSSAAHEAYLRGRFFWNTRTEAGLRRGLSYFERAVAEDDQYALAHVGVADAYILLTNYGAVAPNEALPRAIDAAERALAIEPGLAEAAMSRAWARWVYELDWDEASVELPKAIERSPSHSFSYQLYASYLAALGRHDDAIEEMRRARELDPFSLVINAVLAWHHFLAHEPELAVEQSLRTLEMDAEFSRAYSYLGWAHLQRSNVEDGVAALERSRQLVGTSLARTAELAHGYAAAGRVSEARQLLSELERAARELYVPADLIAKIHLALGDDDAAVRWLERALADRSVQRVSFNVDPLLDPLRDDARFDAILKRLHIPGSP